VVLEVNYYMIKHTDVYPQCVACFGLASEWMAAKYCTAAGHSFGWTVGNPGKFVL